MFKKSQVFQKMQPSTKLVSIITFPAVLFSILWDHLSRADNIHYLSFADQRLILGIPNFFDVMSNLPFAIVGVYGALLATKNKNLHSNAIYQLFLFFSVSIFFVSLGSAYFHWVPTIYRLFWDRLPMSLGFASVLGILVMDRTNAAIGRWFFGFALLFAVASTVLWHLQIWDLRPYVITQFGTLLMIVFILILFPDGKIQNSNYWKGFVFYALAKVTEVLDLHIFSSTHILSGHSIKHLLAAWGIYEIMKMYKMNKMGTFDRNLSLDTPT